jgi:hypothetical protein
MGWKWHSEWMVAHTSSARFCTKICNVRVGGDATGTQVYVSGGRNGVANRALASASRTQREYGGQAKNALESLRATDCCRRHCYRQDGDVVLLAKGQGNFSNCLSGFSANGKCPLEPEEFARVIASFNHAVGEER